MIDSVRLGYERRMLGTEAADGMRRNGARRGGWARGETESSAEGQIAF